MEANDETISKVFTLDDLEKAAWVMIREIKGLARTLGDLREARIAVIGGMALIKYLPDHRSMETDVDLLIVTKEASRIKQKLLSAKPDLFKERADLFCYLSETGGKIPIDVVPSELCPYIPAAAEKVDNIVSRTGLPYMSKTDLLVFKIYCCGLRPRHLQREIDFRDAEKLLCEVLRELELQHGPIAERLVQLNAEQRNAATDGFQSLKADFLTTERGKHHWMDPLGIFDVQRFLGNKAVKESKKAR